MTWLALVLLGLALIGTPLFAIIGASALLGFAGDELDLQIVTIEIYRLAEMPVLLAIPLFTFAGYLLSESQVPARLVRLAQAWLGWLPGGLPIVAVVTCALFTAFTGASGITIVAIGALLVPALAQAGYPERFNLGLVTSAGSLGLLFAPSVPLILYGVIAQQVRVGPSVNIDDLFIAGIVPGLLMIVVLAAWCMRQGLVSTHTRQPFRAGEAWRAMREAWLEIPLPFVVLGGIYSGYLVVSEAAAVTAIYVMLATLVIRREIKFRALPAIVRESMMLVGGILIILGASLASTNYLIDTDAPGRVFAWVQPLIADRWTFLAALNLFLLVLGTMLDIFSALVIVVPLILPLAMSYGVHPLHLGIVFLANMQIGYFTPPVGMNLFIASYRFDKPVMTLYRASLPFFFLLLLALLIITYWPALSLAPAGE